MKMKPLWSPETPWSPWGWWRRRQRAASSVQGQRLTWPRPQRCLQAERERDGVTNHRCWSLALWHKSALEKKGGARERKQPNATCWCKASLDASTAPELAMSSPSGEGGRLDRISNALAMPAAPPPASRASWARMRVGRRALPLPASRCASAS